MKFELNEYKASLTDEEILSDIKQVADSLNVDYISINTYKKHGKYSQTAIQGHFGTWKRALSLAGLRNERTSRELKLISDDDYIADVQRVAAVLGSDTVGYDDYKKNGTYSAEHIFTRFSTWENFLLKAGLKPTGFSKHKITKEELYEEIERIWILLGRQPTSTDIIKHGVSKYSIDTYKRRFGGWRKALEAFVDYVNSDNTEEIPDEFDIPMNVATDSLSKSNSEPNPNQQARKPGHFTSRNINLRMRFLVMKRDNFKCCMCGRSPATTVGLELHIDHIIPWSKGGETIIDNLHTLCSDCNLGKSNLSETE